MKLIVTKSKWNSTNVTRLTIVEENGLGKIQVDLLQDDKDFGHVAYIWDLYVEKKHRRQGIAKELMETALKQAIGYGYDTAILEWNLQDTSYDILDWYISIGFEDSKFSEGYALLTKKLNSKKQ